MWFIRFSLDASSRLLACGSRTGRVFMWDMDTVSPHPRWRVKRPLGKHNTVSEMHNRHCCCLHSEHSSHVRSFTSHLGTGGRLNSDSASCAIESTH
jgi:hypothetical protein